MNRVGQGFEARAVRGRGEAAGRWFVLAIVIDGVAQRVGLGRTLGILQIPSLIDDEILPAELLELRVEDGHVLAELFFVDGEAVGVPTAPTHGRSGRERGWESWRRNGLPVCGPALRAPGGDQQERESGRTYRLHPHGDKHTKICWGNLGGYASRSCVSLLLEFSAEVQAAECICGSSDRLQLDWTHPESDFVTCSALSVGVAGLCYRFVSSIQRSCL